ncbi:MAG: NAD(P)-dependent glycerol-3-phosphate dehydrogenase [Clostridia bacterium]|jgi:glycerol-3-phosphate dehydrogenase (NAD(P)+)|nr:NAD(P)-dependent glycerol-3-phosphate dehydrogenase [Clostridia bacterium]
MKKIAIIGSGSWGVALAIYLAGQGHSVNIWSFSEEERDLLNKDRKCKFLPNAVIPENVYCSTDMKEVLEGTEIILHVTPSKFTRDTIKKYKDYVKNQSVIICSKGFEADTLKTLDDVAKEELPNNKIGVLSGPSHAEEVSILIPTALVVASEYKELSDLVVDIFKSEKMRMYTSQDVKGVELGGALKNIIAFCAGVSAGLNLGDNTFAALLTRGLVELSRLGVALGGKKETFYGLTGLGDLIVTCSSMHSRNRRAGMLIGQGKTIEETRKEVGMTIESIDNIEVAYKLAKKYNIEVPIINTVYEVLFNKLDPREAVNILMTRDLKEE